jgi:predicted enzyme related to lactoylglutathione lyase
MSRPVHFEIPADNVDRAQAFYKNVFGWQFQKWDGPMDYWMIVTGPDGTPGINGGLGARRMPDEKPVNTIRVTSLDSAVASITKAGGQVTVPKMAIPGVGWLAYAADTEGNPFGVMEDDANAK